MADFLTLIAAFAGAVIACSFLPSFGLIQVMTGLFVHVTTGFYLASVAVLYLQLTDDIRPGIAFVFAVSARGVLSGLIQVAGRFGRRPPELW